MELAIDIDVVKQAKRSSSGLSLFSVIRNESYLLPFFFSHYRNLGVENFLIYDDHSDDGSSDYLMTQPDCTVIRSDRGFGEKLSRSRRFVHALRFLVPDQFLPKRWVVTADADEFMILPSRFQMLAELTAVLDRQGIVCATAPMVDFYPERLSRRNHGRDVSPFIASNFFDEGPLYAWEAGAKKPKPYFRGIRARLAMMLYQLDRQRFVSIFGSDISTFGSGKPLMALWKVPLIKRGLGVYPVGSHDVNISPQLHINVALAHFKFGPDLDAKVRDALQRLQYHDASVEYRFLQAVLELLTDASLLSSHTRSFRSSRSLEEAGYIYLASDKAL